MFELVLSGYAISANIVCIIFLGVAFYKTREEEPSLLTWKVWCNTALVTGGLLTGLVLLW